MSELIEEFERMVTDPETDIETLVMMLRRLFEMRWGDA
jgi:hypothetical protein